MEFRIGSPDYCTVTYNQTISANVCKRSQCDQPQVLRDLGVCSFHAPGVDTRQNQPLPGTASPKPSDEKVPLYKNQV